MSKSLFHKPHVLLLLVTLSASLLAIPLLFGQSIRLDESQSIWAASKTLNGILEFMAKDVHPPLYLIILHLWMQLLGNSVTITRLLSLLFFITTIPLVYLMAKLTADTKTSLMTVVLFCLSPFILWFGTETRMYALLTLLTALSHWIFIKLMQNNASRYKLAYFLVSLTGLYTQYFFILILFVQFLYVLWLRYKHKFQGLVKMFIIWFILAISYAPWLWYVAQAGFGSASQPLLASPTAYNILQALVNFLFGFQTNTLQSFLVSFWPLLVLFFFLVFTNRSQLFSENLGYFFLASLLPIAITFGVSFIRPVFLPRYLIFTIPSLFLLISWSLTRSRHRIAQTITAILLFFMGIAVISQGLTSRSPASEDYYSVNQYLTTVPTYQDIVAVTSPFTIYPVEYGYKGRARLTTIPLWDRYTDLSIPAYNEAEFDTQLNQLREIYYRLFVVFSYDQGYAQQIRMFLDTHYQLLDDQEFGENIKVRVYQLRYD